MEKNDFEKTCNKIFGDFKPFKELYISMKFGSLPTTVHPTPRSIAKVCGMGNWPSNVLHLRDLETICYICRNQCLFSSCKKCLKAVVGECKGLYEEACEELSKKRDRHDA